MTSLSRHLAATVLVAGLGTSVAVTAATGAVAQPSAAETSSAKSTVDQAKAAGIVGEQADGFLGIVSGGDTSIRAAVAEINAGRAEAYRQAAARTGVSPAAAGEATAQQLLARLPPGQYFKGSDGQWRRK